MHLDVNPTYQRIHAVATTTLHLLNVLENICIFQKKVVPLHL